MKEYSKTEYKYLKEEIKEIKACITRYLGYIIGVSGVTIIIAKYLLNPESGNQKIYLFKPFSSIVVISSIIIITFLFEILWYKFKSHNRHAGYLQLLLQEMEVYKLTDAIKYDKNKTYLFDKMKLEKENIQFDIITWEYMMSRLNDTKEKNSIEEIKKTTAKSRFRFVTPDRYNIKKINNWKNLDSKFFKECIYKQFYPLEILELTKTQKFKKIILYYLYNFYSLWFDKKRKNLISDIDTKYLSAGWQYPIKIIQLGFLSILGLSFGFFWTLTMKYEIVSNVQNIRDLINIATAMVIIWIVIIAFWLKRYIGSYSQITSGKYSIDYYCWQFFIFRVQYLNSLNLTPEYFSRNYIRFFKTQGILSYIEKELFGNNSIEIVKNNGVIVNSQEMNKYFEDLKNLKNLNENQIQIHDKVNQLARKYLTKFDDLNRVRKPGIHDTVRSLQVYIYNYIRSGT